MEKLVYVEEVRKNEIIASAIEKETPCVLTRRGDRGWQPCKSRLVSHPEAVGRLLLSASADTELGTGEPLTPGERVGVTFRRGHKKCMFATTVTGPVALEPTAGDAIECIELQWPEGLQELQRRVYFRATPLGRRVNVRFWPGGVVGRADAERDGGTLMVGVLQDLSAGGMRIKTTDVAPDTFAEGDAVGCAFAPKPRGETLILDGTFRHCQVEDDGSASIGVQFVGLEASERGRETLAALARVVTDFQRGQARQQRMRLVGR